MYEAIAGTRILITGGAGFIGSNLTDFLLGLGGKVTVLDNFSTGRRENLRAAAAHPGFRLIEGDIRDPETCAAAAAGTDLAVHLAALGSVPRSIQDPCASTAVNVGGFVNVLFSAVRAGVTRVIYASSSSVYGDDPQLPKIESRTGRPLSPYALTKTADEWFAENFRAVYALDSIGLRFFNVFGRRQDPDGAYAAVIPRFAAALLRHTPPVINGDGSYSRDFTYVDNVLHAVALALCVTDPAAVNQVYNVACGARVTLNELCAVLRDELGRFDAAITGIEPVHGAVRAGDIPHSLADIGKARRLLGYEPRFDVRRGLALAARWYAENL
ncbi:MAG: NAD-dependent epimerase/dehydratase family protein [Lentisphaeria bacterium]|nr:NAD-dependent epimerase/dehydratase family protein [Lentisphaeria bacterium]